MNRQVGQARIWAVLGAFLFFSICLPLGHVCLSYPVGAAPQATYADSGALNQGQPLAWQEAKLGETHEDAVCQACLIAQNLFLDDRVVDLTIIDSVTAAVDRLYAPVIAVADSTRSAFKRAPPTGR